MSNHYISKAGTMSEADMAQTREDMAQTREDMERDAQGLPRIFPGRPVRTLDGLEQQLRELSAIATDSRVPAVVRKADVLRFIVDKWLK